MSCTSSSCVMWPSLPRLLIFFGSSFWYLEQNILSTFRWITTFNIKQVKRWVSRDAQMSKCTFSSVSLCVLIVVNMLRADIDWIPRVRCSECNTDQAQHCDSYWLPSHRSQCRQLFTVWEWRHRTDISVPPHLWPLSCKWCNSDNKKGIRDQLTPECTQWSLDTGHRDFKQASAIRDHHPESVTRLWSLILRLLSDSMERNRRILSLA